MTGRWVAVAPARATRPGASSAAGDSADACPFCAGHEDQTPPETLRLGDGPTGWDVRVVPNLYPALERQEVVIHGADPCPFGRRARRTPRSSSSPRPGSDARATSAATASRSSTRAATQAPRCRTRTRSSPGCRRRRPAVIAERGLPEVVPVLERDGLVAGCPVASRVPYEVLIAPARAEPRACASDLLGPALCLLAELVRRLQRVRGETLVPLNAWLHDGPHWHLELFPRTTRLAGLELGAGRLHQPGRAGDAAAALRGWRA